MKRKNLIIIAVATVASLNMMWLYQRYQQQQQASAARQQLNTALQLWDVGQLSEADQHFQQLAMDYPKTVAATQAIEARQQRLAQYRQDFMAQHVNRLDSTLAQQVGQQLDEYRQTHGEYPLALSALPMSEQSQTAGYLTRCNYESALFAVAYALDCQAADEQAAAAQLQQAITTWESGELLVADNAFKAIVTDYPNTPSAASAKQIHQAKIATYRQTFTQQNRLRSPRMGKVTQKVREQLAQFHETSGNYPQQLNELGLFHTPSFAPYLKNCRYTPALFNAGYRLDCNEADSHYISRLGNVAASSGSAALSALRQSRKKAAIRSMGNLFNPDNQIPTEGFTAYYFSSDNPEKIVFKENVDTIAINYSWDDFHNIHANEFGAYWVGNINVPETTFKQLNITDGRLQARVLLDGRVVYDSKRRQPPPVLTLRTGQHVLEVELLNGWHTTEFFADLSDLVMPLTMDEVRDYFAENRHALGEFDVFYAAAYESGQQNLSLPLNILENDRPIVLVLSSYSAIKWVINNPYHVPIKAIVYASHEKGSSIVNAAPTTQLLPAEKRIGDYKLKAQCHCQDNGQLACRSSISDDIQRLTGQALRGFAGEYDPQALTIPARILSDRFQRIAATYDKRFSKQRQACLAKHEKRQLQPDSPLQSKEKL